MKKSKIISILFFASFFIFNMCYAEKIGIVTDIQAGKTAVRNRNKYTKGNIIYPRKYKTYFSRALREAKSAGVEKMIALGDNVDMGKDRKRAKILVEMAKKAGMEMLWIKGNHDGNQVSKIFFPDSASYYSKELDNWKIIVLDSNEGASPINGGVSATQLAWLETQIAETEKNILVAMHHPIWNIRGSPTRRASAGLCRTRKYF